MLCIIEFYNKSSGKLLSTLYVKLFSVNKRQLAIAIISCICGTYAICIAFSRNSSIYGYESRHQSAYTIKNILLLYGSHSEITFLLILENLKVEVIHLLHCIMKTSFAQSSRSFELGFWITSWLDHESGSFN